MAGAIERVWIWAATLPYWEQRALDKICSVPSLTDKDYKELLEYLLQDIGIEAMPALRPATSFAAADFSEVKGAPCRLERIFNLKNVNALPGNQEIQFGPRITLIYGENGAGKTGYVRPIASAAFARGERDVLPNASRTSRETPEAEIEFSVSGTLHTTKWINGQRCPELAGVYVFDAASLDAHLMNSNPMSFSPSGLDVLPRLAQVTDEVRERLKLLIAEWERPHGLDQLFEGDSETSRRITTIDGTTKPAELGALARFSAGDEKELAGIEQQVAELKARDLPRYLARRRQELRDLQALRSLLQTTTEALGATAEQKAAELLSELQATRAAAQALGVAQFASERFTEIGTDQWLQFVTAAKALADAEASNGLECAQGEPCLLCRQPLSAPAADLIQRLWNFIASDSQARAAEAETKCATMASELEAIALTFFGPDSAARRLLEAELPNAVPMVESQIAACETRREELVQSLRTASPKTPAPLTAVDFADMDTAIKQRREEIAELERSDTSLRLREKEASARELRHRRLFCQRLPEFEAYVRQRLRAKTARERIGSTRHITDKHAELFKELVTDRYISTFQETIQRIGLRMAVMIETFGQKGDIYRRIALSPVESPARLPLNEVLSEGEMTVVAIADFLTEATIDNGCSGLVLDDPVTSLDHRWKEAIARILVEHAASRQVVILTHDLVFLHHVAAAASEMNIDWTPHWVQARDEGPGFVYLNNSPVCEANYKSATIARDWYSKSKDAAPEEQQHHLQQGFAALRTSYEALIMFELFNGVVQRFQERVRFESLKNVRIDQTLAEEIVDRMGGLSRCIEGHSHSDSFAHAKPNPKLLLEEIEAFEDMKKRIRTARGDASKAVVIPIHPQEKVETRGKDVRPQRPA